MNIETEITYRCRNSSLQMLGSTASEAQGSRSADLSADLNPVTSEAVDLQIQSSIDTGV